MSLNCFIALLFLISTPASAPPELTLTIEIVNLRSNKGKILVQVYDESQNPVASGEGTIENKQCKIIIYGLKPAKYGFKYFHDENGNSELETNWMGMPTEGFGFSNNSSGRFGPPAFEKWLFKLDHDDKQVCIPKYL